MLTKIRKGQGLKDIHTPGQIKKWGDCGSGCPCGLVSNWLTMASAYMKWWSSDPF